MFTAVAVYDRADFGMPITRSLDELVAVWTSNEASHPVAHHTTNIVVTPRPDGTTPSANPCTAPASGSPPPDWKPHT